VIKARPPAGKASGALELLTVGCAATFRAILEVKGTGPAKRANIRRQAGIDKKKGRTEVRPKFREEKPEGLAVRSGEPASHRTVRMAAVYQEMVNDNNLFWPARFFSGGRDAMVSPAMDTPQRRLSDKILSAFDQACDRGELDVAELLVRALELTLTRTGGKGSVDQRSEMGPVIETYARLKQMRSVERVV
jgi:hypothetical protein